MIFRQGSATDPAGGAHDAPPDPLVGWGGGYPLPIPHSPRRLRRLGSRRLRRLEFGPPTFQIKVTPLAVRDRALIIIRRNNFNNIDGNIGWLFSKCSEVKLSISAAFPILRF